VSAIRPPKKPPRISIPLSRIEIAIDVRLEMAREYVERDSQMAYPDGFYARFSERLYEEASSIAALVIDPDRLLFRAPWPRFEEWRAALVAAEHGESLPLEFPAVES
jgi:hypothetical protein